MKPKTINARKLHQTIGLILVLPMIGWIITGIIFFIKPGYQQAYEQLSIKTYPIEIPLSVTPEKNWLEAKLFRTVLGHHLIIKTDAGSTHLDPNTRQAMPKPNNEELKGLVADALSHNPDRYGNIEQFDGTIAITNTGVEVTFDWDSLSIRQKGRDTKLIGTLYKIHYLQWTPNKEVNQVMGIAGLLLLFGLTLFGVKIYLKSRR